MSAYRKGLSRRRRAIAGTLAVSLVLTGCANNPDGAPMLGTAAGMVTGGVVGGAIGRHVGGRPGMIVGAMLGTAIGGMIGNEIGRSLSEADRKVAHEKFAVGLSEGATGERRTWATPDRTAVASYTPSAPRKQPAQARLVRPKTVEAPAGLDVIAAPYVAKVNTDVVSRPGAGGDKLGKLVKGEKVTVLGKVTGQPWYLVSRSGTALGYVAASKLTPHGQAVAGATLLTQSPVIPDPLAESGLAVSDVPVQTTCRDMSYQIVKSGAEAEQGTFQGCKQMDGNWAVVPAKPTAVSAG